ncbi:MAG: ABC transporter substrate-binding protein [Rhodospirillaceae bacterium]|jgi:microcin C transport system substrate-binding protein|nr:ABC transporter substrate-binding protein [Rhodospirillaceae bacterium]MBT3494849.1 ABC transporter substrate-binding protein [Rhodospirillaceae bacterium]MBT3781880.1 ABC transporter substrate-binding protein [Rhodospirillaceae bacterium]MBT3976491.1 ABC transporter substrate-binding protein [Rhodospirillaceae bacterium]MBT4167623.1 ABC transporter substrate-binding protein [Rhodospirillaceae bacterium]
MIRPVNSIARLLLLLTLAPFLIGTVPALAEPSHGFAVLGSLKYGPDFKHFDYVNSDAPKGGRLRLWYNGNFDSLNPFILKGHWAAGSNPFGVDGRLLTFETLMIGSGDEEDSYYGLIAGGVEIPDDRQSITFTLRPAARWHDGSAISADDVAFSFDILKTKGHPVYRVLFKDITGTEVLGPRKVRFNFAKGVLTRDLPATVAAMPVLSKSWYSDHDFTKTTMTPPMGSGPYRVEKVDPGRSITYVLVDDHWGKDLAVYRGRNNFRRITWDYYRDRDIALESLFAGKIDFREDFTSRNWATKYDDVPAVKDGRLIKEILPDQNPSGFQAFFLNTRRAKFTDRRVRQAIGLVFDFEWTNKNLFHGLYQRTYSIFQNSDMEATGAPVGAELALLEPWRKDLPKEVFGEVYRAPKTKGTGNIRGQLRQAKKLLGAAGWKVRDGKLVNGAGKSFEIEFLSYGKAFERIVMPYIRNLEKLGITARFRLVEPAQYQRRVQEFDFDITTFRNSSSLTPGLGLRSAWNSKTADMTGGRNYTGLKSPAVDALIEKIIQAGNRDELRHATHALDRVIMWSHNLVPQWFKASHTIAYWDLFGRPASKPKYARGVLDTWWWDPAKAAKLGRN